MPASDFRAGLKRWMQGEGTVKRALITGLAEMLGTAMLVFMGCMGCIAGLGVAPFHLQIAITFGFAVMVVIQCIGHISQAHINPAITVGAIILGKKTIPEALVYFVSQMTGAILGYGMLKVVTPKDKLTSGTVEQADMFCVTDLHSDLSAIQGLLVESIATAFLMLVVCSVWDVRNEKNTDSVPIKFGLAVAVLAITVGPYTGCSMNPARSFAPALWNGQWRHHWIYWFGPIGGALISSFMYKTIFGVSDKVEEEEEPVPEAVALNSVESHKQEQS
ncbi:PREDICTED: aquaporin AQPcic-like isoform X2 [Wasmannia auropunctata]|uniref:aquaporin AQPcic-like isoform X2 n=1 Tax=Wasmannia auropunctata TaxID=64793 RepID=UPI0005EDCA78|nr:PREDICTED: aquaporin AQPcic-like isoform X2 [Wasmannia auropunctata]